jgi:hypothetical protein
VGCAVARPSGRERCERGTEVEFKSLPRMPGRGRRQDSDAWMYRIEEDAASPELALTLCRENGAQRLVMISMKVGVRKKELVGLKGRAGGCELVLPNLESSEHHIKEVQNPQAAGVEWRQCSQMWLQPLRIKHFQGRLSCAAQSLRLGWRRTPAARSPQLARFVALNSPPSPSRGRLHPTQWQ